MARNRASYSANQIIEALKCNDHSVLSEWYRIHFPAVQHFILQNNGTEDDAKDMYQEAMLALWSNARQEKLNGTAQNNIGGYLFQISKYKWLDKLKSKQHRSTTRLVHDQRSDNTDQALEEAIVYDAQIEALRGMYSRLGDTCKAILEKFYFQKQSLDDIGQDLNYDAATLRTKKYRCMMQLRKMLHDKNNP